jgi:tetratricopeptide (TPR) repeat protein
VTYEDYDADLERCRELIEADLFDRALTHARTLLERAGGDAEVVSVFCEAALAAKQPAAAIRACRRYLALGVVDNDVLEWLIRAQYDLHLTEECRRTCRLLLERDPGNYTALDHGLDTLLELGDFEDGRDIIDAAGELEDDPHLGYQVAVARMMRDGEGEAEWARERFERFLEREPNAPGSYINLMRIHHLAERYEQVEALFVEARRRGIDHPDLTFNMGLALKAQDRGREAVRFFIQTVRANAELPDAHFHLAQILRAVGHPRLAMSMLQRELEVDDTQPAVHAEMAWCAEDDEEYALAVRMIRAAVERAPDWAVYRHSLAELIMRAGGDLADAEAAAREAVDLDGRHAAGWQVLGRIAAERGDLERAERYLRRAVRARDATTEDEGWLGLVLAERDLRQDARPLLERAARTYPFWEPVGDALGRIRGHPLPVRFEVRLARSGPERLFRVLHVVASDEDGARETVERARDGEAPDSGEVVEEIRPLGFELDHDGGVVWDSGPSRSRYPRPPEE